MKQPSRLGMSPARRVLAIAAASLLLGLPIPAPAAAVEGVITSADTRYRVEPAAKRIRVRVTATLTNTRPSRTEGAFIATPYLDHFVIPLVGEARNVRARSSVGGNLATSTETDRGVSALLVDLSPNLVHGTPQTVTVDFDLPGQPPRSRSVTRVNEGFASWFVFGSGDPGEIDITVDVPASFDLSLSKNVPWDTSTSRRRRLYRMRGIRNADNAGFFAAALDDGRLSVRTFDVGGTDVTVKSWPDDPRWQRFTRRWIRRGLPVLEELVGLQPPRDDLTVLESSRTYHHGYAGVYVPELGTIEVGDVLDKTVLLHELTHMWFNDELFSPRWISEGLAAEVTDRALEQLGETPDGPRPIRAADSGAVRLNEWSAPDPLEPPGPAAEAFAYNASHAIVHEIVEEIGDEGLRKVLAAASDGRLAYGRRGEDERTTLRDWRYFYDLAEIEAGSSVILPLFRDHVVEGHERRLLGRRTSAKQRFDDFVASAQGWMPPLPIRRDMGNWSFAGIEQRFGQAAGRLHRARALVDRYSAVGLDADERLQREFEGAPSFSELNGTLDRYDEAAADVAAFRDAVASAGLFTRIGLIGADMELTEVQQAIDAGADERIADLLRTELDALGEAQRRGLALTAAALLLAVVAAAHASRWLRMRPRRKG